MLRGESAFFERGEVREAVTRLRGAARGGEATGDLGADVRSVLSSMNWSDEPPSGTGAVRDRWENLLRLVTLADDLAGAIPRATLTDLVDDLDRRAATQSAPTADGVTLATVHAAKGLEWDAVFVVGLVAGHLPDPVRRHAGALEEERRLFYVACTRARTHLALSWARSRTGRGRRERSPFLDAVVGPRASRRAGGASCGGSGSRSERAAADAARRRAGSAAARSSRGGVRARPVPHLPGDVRRGAARPAQGVAHRRGRRRSVPAYVVLTDATLETIATELPADSRALVRIPGIGARKLEDYGEPCSPSSAARPDRRPRRARLTPPPSSRRCGSGPRSAMPRIGNCSDGHCSARQGSPQKLAENLVAPRQTGA